MEKLLFTDTPEGARIPVIVAGGWEEPDVTEIVLSRGDVEGNPRALQARITFDPSRVRWRLGSRYDFDVKLQLFTDRHVVSMVDGTDDLVPDDLNERWDLMSVSGGAGTIHAGLLRLQLTHKPRER